MIIYLHQSLYQAEPPRLNRRRKEASKMRIRQYEYLREQVATYNYPCDTKINSTDDVANLLNDFLKIGSKAKEHFYVFTLNTKLKITGVNLVSVGDLDSAPVHPREVFTAAINTPGTACIIIAHNHPSGDCSPSAQDVEVTERLKEAGNILGIKVLDHVIVGGGSYTSLNSQGYL